MSNLTDTEVAELDFDIDARISHALAADSLALDQLFADRAACDAEITRRGLR